MTILPNQSGEIRLPANLLDTRRRSAPPTKGAGSGRLGGHREKEGGRRNGYGEAGRFACRRIFWIRGDASRRQRKRRGTEGWAGIERRMAEAERVRRSGEIRLAANLLDTRRRSAPPTKGAGSGRLGGHREKDGGRRNEYGEAGRFA